MIKKEEIKLKASIRKESKIKKIKDRGYNRGSSQAFLDLEDDDDESFSISKIKNQFKRTPNQSDRSKYSDSEESDSQEKDKKNENNDDDSDLVFYDEFK